MTQPDEKTTCPKCGSAKASEYFEWWTCDSACRNGAFVQSEQCKDRELASLRAQLAEAKRELTLCENFQLLKLTAATSRAERLGLRVKWLELGIRSAWLDLGDIIRESLDTEVHRISVPDAIRQLYAFRGNIGELLAKPEEGNDEASP